MQVAFYEGYNLGRECLYQSAAQVDTSSNTHVFFSFGTFDASWKISVGDEYGRFEFEQFKRLPRVKKVLSIGGWDFSTFPAYYQFFRNAVLPANRQAFANSVAAFVKQHNLDGVNIDWEYPGVSDRFVSILSSLADHLFRRLTCLAFLLQIQMRASPTWRL
jgi:hypothetical protein